MENGGSRERTSARGESGFWEAKTSPDDCFMCKFNSFRCHANLIAAIAAASDTAALSLFVACYEYTQYDREERGLNEWNGSEEVKWWGRKNCEREWIVCNFLYSFIMFLVFVCCFCVATSAAMLSGFFFLSLLSSVLVAMAQSYDDAKNAVAFTKLNIPFYFLAWKTQKHLSPLFCTRSLSSSSVSCTHSSIICDSNGIHTK